MSAIAIDSLTKRYGSLVAVDDVSLEIAEGEVVVVLGPNGAGKTTTLEIAEGLRTADDGTVSILGSAPGSADVLARVGVMPQQGDLYTGIRTEEAIRLFASFYDDHEEPGALLERLDLTRVRRTTYRHLSGGERRRLSLALALVGKPDVAFLDEPTAEMDVEGRATTWDLVRELRDRGTTVVLTTHLLDEAERVADRVAIMHHGRLVAVGTPAELSRTDRPEITLETATPIDVDAFAAHVGGTVDALGGRAYRISGEPVTPELVSRITGWLSARRVLVRTLHVGARSLEEVYLELTR
jgi:ABC-2 type transport system ATP-binding protein